MKEKIDNKPQWSNGYFHGWNDSMKSKWKWISVFENNELLFCAKVISQRENMMTVEIIDYCDAVIFWGTGHLMNEKEWVEEPDKRMEISLSENVHKYIDQSSCMRDFIKSKGDST